MSIDTYPPRNYTQYEEGSFTVTATGFSGTAPSGIARYVRIGKQVTLTLPTTLDGTSNATTFSITGLLPTLRPATGYVEGFIRTFSGGAHSAGIWTIDNTGVVNFHPLPSLVWPATGQKSVGPGTMAYSL